MDLAAIVATAEVATCGHRRGDRGLVLLHGDGVDGGRAVVIATAPNGEFHHDFTFWAQHDFDLG